MIRTLILALGVAVGVGLMPVPAPAQTDPAAQARAAREELDAAAAQLDAADGARDRVRALTATVQAYEQGLAAMRAGLRQATQREAQLSARLAAHDGEIAALLGVLLGIGGTPTPVALLHPEGPTGTIRAGMLLAELTPALNARATALRADVREIQTLRQLQTQASENLRTGLQQVQQARTGLNQAMAGRTDLPKRFTADPIRTAILIDSSETLAGFASGLSQITTDDPGATPLSLADRKGDLPLPVQGLVLRAANEADAAGVRRPGLILATRAQALVTSPAAATIRYTGPLLDLGNIVILEPQANMLFVLAGLDEVYGEAGDVIGAGTPVGLMPRAVAGNGTIASTGGDGTGTERSETLYIEVRQDNIPQDPEIWFRTDKDG